LAGEGRFKTSATAIAAKNPKVDLKIVKEARDYIAERRAGGRLKRGYTLSPHSKSL
jgi:hypothetical protein